ncbi:MAG: PAS domain-containing protein [Chloroflexi bacterium]|nr:PAS domain-containing protein [Chloroflexota bacterium]MBT5628217.1 PAS domain-containing protein [Chloroflexota bacterium]
MGNVSLRWRMLIETGVLVAIVAAGTLLFGVVGTVLAGIVAVFAVVILSLRITSQFSDLTEDVVRMTSIERSHRIDPTGPAELVRLARAVNRLVDRVDDSISEDSAERIRLASILDSMREGVVVVDDQGVIESANPASIEMLSSLGDVEPGMQLTSLTNHPDVIGVVTRSIESEQAVSGEIELFDNQRTLMAVSTPFPRPESDAARALLLLTDLTDLRRLDTTRREFVSNASHELRTPLAGIRASAETLQRGAIDDPEGRGQFLKMIREDVDRMDKLITEMLELSRLESGEASLVFADVEPAKLVDSALKQFSAIAVEAEVKLTSRLAADMPMVSVDAEKIDHVFTNLISNAMKWTPAGGTIVVKGWVDDGTVWFSIDDSGLGIEPEHLPHIFERFFKTDPARTQPGTGLGLSIARHIVDAHGGVISATSTVGEGSEFAFTVLPATAD